MSASMTITITEDTNPDGEVTVSFNVEGFDVEGAEVDTDLPPAVVLGAEMMKLVNEL